MEGDHIIGKLLSRRQVLIPLTSSVNSYGRLGHLARLFFTVGLITFCNLHCKDRPNAKWMHARGGIHTHIPTHITTH